MNVAKTPPFLSVIIPTLNEEKYLPTLLNCLTHQTDQDFEVIISDAKSSDKTVSVASEYSQKLNLIVISSDKKNVAHQRNMGAESASANYLLFLDADGGFGNNFIQHLRTEIEKDLDANFIFYLGVQTSSLLIRFLSKIINAIVFTSQFLPNSFTSGGFICVKKDVFNNVGGYDETIYYAEDTDLTNRIRHANYRVKLLYDLVVIFSLRRVEKIGLWRALKILIWGSLPLLIWGTMKAKMPLFEYPMHGGGSYKTDQNN